MKKLTLTIEPGEQIALFGSDDIGKMAIIYSLLRYYQNTNEEGFIKISNQSVENIGRKCRIVLM